MFQPGDAFHIFSHQNHFLGGQQSPTSRVKLTFPTPSTVKKVNTKTAIFITDQTQKRIHLYCKRGFLNALNCLGWPYIQTASKHRPKPSKGSSALVSPHLLRSILFPSRISSTQTFCTDSRLGCLHDQLCSQKLLQETT